MKKLIPSIIESLKSGIEQIDHLEDIRKRKINSTDINEYIQLVSSKNTKEMLQKSINDLKDLL